MQPIHSPEGDKPVRMQLETMDDVSKAEAAIVLARSATEDKASKDYQSLGHIQAVSLVSNPDYLPLPLSFKQSQDVIAGLEIAADNEIRHGQLNPEVAQQWLGSLGVREVEPRFHRATMPVLRLVEPELEISIARLAKAPEPTAA